VCHTTRECVLRYVDVCCGTEHVRFAEIYSSMFRCVAVPCVMSHVKCVEV